MGDIDVMFSQVHVPKCHFLRFVWWPDADLSQDLEEHQMKVHLFGATSPPSCSKFALRKQADDAEKMLEQRLQMFCERTLRLITVCALKKKEILLSK